MNAAIASTLAFRRVLLKITGSLSDAQLDTIPAGFRNNIRWQLAHVVVSQGLLTYGRCAQSPPNLSAAFIAGVRKGTTPADMSADVDYGRDRLGALLISQSEQLERDLPQLQTCAYESYETSTGYVLSDVVTAAIFSGIHDGLHLGNIMALRKLV